MEVMSDRQQVRVYLSGSAKAALDREVKLLRTTQTDLLSHLVEEFSVLTKAEKLRRLGILAEDEEIAERVKPNARKAG